MDMPLMQQVFYTKSYNVAVIDTTAFFLLNHFLISFRAAR